jgi:hypothetical protein
MFFLIRVAFWLSIVIILLPTSSQQPTPTIETAEAVSAASAVVSDMRKLCDRQPDVCNVGSQAAVAFGYKAQAGAKMLYEFLSDALAPTETGSVSAVQTREISAKSQNTLAPADLAPAWRGPPPMPRPDPRDRHV